MKRKVQPTVDPIWPYSEIEIEGKVYKMCFTYRALRMAEARLISLGYSVSLVGPMMRMSYAGACVLFAVGLYTYHPELDIDRTQEWVTQDNLYEILTAVNNAWRKSMPDSEQANPPQPEK